MYDIVELSRFGTPAVLIASAPMIGLAQRTAAACTPDELRLVSVAHPLTNIPEDEVREKGHAAGREILAILG